MKRLILNLVLFLFIFALIQGFFAYTFESRSGRSRLIDIGFRLRRPFILPLTDENVEAYFNRRYEINTNPITIPSSFRSNATLTSFEALDVVVFDTKETTEQVIIYLHGGSYVNPPSWIHFHFLSRLQAQYPTVIYMPLYPRAPNATVTDALEALNLFYEELRQTHPTQSMVLMGDSAGASLALAWTLERLEQEEEGPATLVMISPWLNLALDHPEIEAVKPFDSVLNPPAAVYLGNAWRGDVPIDDPRVSPLFGELERLTMPMKLVMGEYDVLRPDAEVFAQEAARLNLDLTFEVSPYMLHVYPLFPFLPEAQQSLEAIVAFLEEAA